MTIASGATILASDIQAIKDDIDAVVSASSDFVGAAETTTSTSYTNLSTAGPAVTLTTGTTALVVVYCGMFNNTSGEAVSMSFEVSGSSSVSADTNLAMSYEVANAGDVFRASATFLLTTLTAGSNTFTAKYRVTGGTGTFSDRRIAVVPLGA